MKRNWTFRFLALLITVGMIFSTIRTSAIVFAEQGDAAEQNSVVAESVEPSGAAEPAREAKTDAPAPKEEAQEAVQTPAAVEKEEPAPAQEAFSPEPAAEPEKAETDGSDEAVPGAPEKETSDEDQAEDPSAETADSESEKSDDASDDAQAEDAEKDEAKADAEKSDDAKPAETDTEKTESENTETEEAEDEMPAQDFEGGAGGVVVSVTAPKGAFPKDTTMQVEPVESKEVLEAVNTVIEGEVVSLKAVDITFWNDGAEIEPKVPVTVKLNAFGLKGADTQKVVHIEDDNKAKVISEAENNGVSVSAEFETPGFSIYIVVDEDIPNPEENAVATYEFYVGDELKQTQHIKSGDKLMDPGALAGDGANSVFKGWYVDEDQTIDGETPGDPLEFGVKEEIPKTETIKVVAKVETTYYVTFRGEPDADGNRGIVAVDTVTVEGEPGTEGTLDISGRSIIPKADTSAFEGWSESDGGEVLTDTTITVTESTELYAVIVEANWIHFSENIDWETSDSDATYTGPVYVKKTDDLSTKKPADPERRGYEFGGWYKEADCTTEFEWSGTGLDEDITLYAKWNPGDSGYTIIIWKQKVTDAKDAEDSAKTYDFESSEGIEEKTGETLSEDDFTSYTELSFTGFHYGRIEITPDDKKVRADGTTVVNVYYDRNLLTIYFYDGGDTHPEFVPTDSTDNTQQYGLVGDEYVALTRRGNAGNRYWTYSASTPYEGTVYSTASGNTGTQYGFDNGQMVEIEYHQGGGCDGDYWTIAGTTTRYNGNRYVAGATGNSGWGVVDGTVIGISHNDDGWTYPVDTTYTGQRYVIQNIQDPAYVFEGLYGSTLKSNDLEWPDNRAWYQNPGGSGTRLTFLDAFKFEGLSGVNEDNTVLTQYGRALSGSNPIRFYKQNIDGTWPNTAANTVYSTGGTFTITEKYEGFKAAFYRNGNGEWTDASANDTASSTNLNIRFERLKYDLIFVDPTDESTLGTKEDIPYEDDMSKYKIEDPTKKHYEFKGWFEDTAGVAPFDWSSKMPAANKVLFAKWEPVQYHVTLDLNGGHIKADSTQDDEFNVPYGTELDKDSLFQCVEYDSKHEFVGWFFKDGPKGGSVYDYAEVEADVDLIAKWRMPGQVSVIYDAGEHGSGEPVDEFKYATDSSVVLGAPPSTIDEGYEFVGWQTTDGKQYYVNNTFEITEDLIENYNEETKTGEVKIVAVYNDMSSGPFETTSITYNANGGEGEDVVVDKSPADETKGLLVNEKVVAKTDTECGFTREGYVFVKWNTDKDGKGLAVQAGDDIAADMLSLDNNTDDNILYAQWRKIPTVTLSARKMLEGRDWKDGESFEFTLSSEEAPLPEEKTVTLTEDEPTAEFETIEFPEAKAGDSYTYTVSETSTLPGGIEKPDDVEITVTISESDGELTATASPEVAEITNIYKPEPVEIDTAELDEAIGTKTVEGEGFAETTFNFSLTAGKDAPEAEQTTASVTASAAGDYPIGFGKIKFEEAGTFTYTITETGDPAKGWSCKETTATATVKIEDNEEGRLTAAITPASITNSYKPEPVEIDTAELDEAIGTKTVVGEGFDATTFTFSITPVESAPKAEETEASVAVTEATDYTIDFGKIKFEEAGTFTYTITETNKMGKGWTCEEKSAEATIVIVDEGGELKVDRITPAVIKNEYAALPLTIDTSAEGTPIAEKKITVKDGQEFEEITFNFEITAKDGAPEPSSKAATVEAAEGTFTISFGEITFEEAGEYTYTITETNELGSGWTSPSQEKEVTIKVTDDGKGSLVLDDSFKAVTIENNYEVVKVEVDTLNDKVGVKTVSGSGFEETEFSFSITAKDGAPAPEQTTGSVKAKESGDYAIDFGTITFDAAGTYTYEIEETSELSDGWICAQKTATATIEVTADEEGQLVAEVTSASITNEFTANPHLTIEKETTSTPENGESYALGEEIEYKITVTNDGNSVIKGIEVEDELTGDKWTIDSLAPGEAKEFTASYKVQQADILAGTVHNEATVKGDDVPETDPGTKDDPTEEPNGHLTVTKKATSAIPSGQKGYRPGDEITYEITVENDGNLTITDIVVTDELEGVTVESGSGYTVEDNTAKISSLAPGASVKITATYTVTNEDAANGSVVNNATAEGVSPDPDNPEPEVTPGTDDEPTEPKPNETFKITYKLAGGNYKGKTDDIIETYKLGTVIKIHEAPTRDGYTFKYWKGSSYQPGDSYKVIGDHVFTAVWEKNQEPKKDTPAVGPKTGDNNSIGLWLAMMLLSAAALAVIWRKRRNA